MRISDWSSDVCSSDLGTLFGRNTTGGAVLFVPRKPDNAFSGYVVGRLGSYDRHDLEFALGGALIPDQLMIRVSGQILRRDGFTKNLYDNSRTDNERKTSFRASVVIRPFRSEDSRVGKGWFITSNPRWSTY